MSEFINDSGMNQSYDLTVSDEIRDFLSETSKWAKFLSIVGFIFIGLFFFLSMVITFVGGSMGSAMSEEFGGLSTGIIGIFYIFFTVIYFFPIYYLYKFAVNTKSALNDDDQEYLTDAFDYLKRHYKFMGILTIIALSIYGFMFLMMFLFI